MGRRAAYSVRVGDLEVGFGLVVRDGVTYSAQFRDPADPKKYIFRSTGETARPRAIAKAEQIVREHHTPPAERIRQMDWDATAASLKAGLHREFRTVLDEEGTRRFLQEQSLWP